MPQVHDGLGFVAGLDLEGSGDDRVRVKEVHVDGPFHDTSLRSGQIVRSINQQSFVSCDQAIELIQSTSPGDALTLTVVESEQEATNCPYVYQTTLPWKTESPPVHFASSRGGALVRISHVLVDANSGDSPRAKVGDIVLAVNGVTVSHAIAAFQLMMQAAAKQEDQQHNTITLRCVNLDALFLELVKQYPQISHHVDGNFKFEPCSSATSYGVAYKLQAPFRHFRGPMVANLDVNIDSLHLEDRHENSHLVVQQGEATALGVFENPSVVFQGRYADGIQPFVRKFNAFLERELRHLEALVIRRAWLNQVHGAMTCTAREPDSQQTATADEGNNSTEQVLPAGMDSI